MHAGEQMPKNGLVANSALLYFLLFSCWLQTVLHCELTSSSEVSGWKRAQLRVLAGSLFVPCGEFANFTVLLLYLLPQLDIVDLKRHRWD